MRTTEDSSSFKRAEPDAIPARDDLFDVRAAAVTGLPPGARV
jgi:hypothetical protein